MKLVKRQVLGVNITLNSKEEILSVIKEYLHQGSDAVKHSPFVIATPNPEQMVLANRDKSFRLILNRADVALPDGIGVVFALRFLRSLSVLRIAGSDFFSDLVRLAHNEHAMIACIGGRHDTAHTALSILTSSYVDLHGWSEEEKEFTRVDDVKTTSMEKIVRRIIDSQTRIVFVGLGAPKQEVYIDTLKKHLVARHAGRVVLMSVGGTLDMVAGVTPRAPRGIQRMGLEWLYRLIREPWRWRRQLQLLRFLYLVFREKIVHTRILDL